jgi:hypothetical protein
VVITLPLSIGVVAGVAHGSGHQRTS